MRHDERKVIFEQRIESMDAESLTDFVGEMRTEVIDVMVARHIPQTAYAEQWDAAVLKKARSPTNFNAPVEEWGRRKKASTRTTSASA